MRGLLRRLREQLRWMRGASEIGMQGVEYDEKTGKIRRKP
jgi:hypothetical protein